MPHDEGVIFIKQRGVRVQGCLYMSAQCFIIFVPANHFQALQQAPGVGVDDEDRTLKCIQQDIIRGFGTDPVYLKQ